VMASEIVGAFRGLNQLETPDFSVAIKLAIKREYATTEGARRVDAAALIGAEKDATFGPLSERHDALAGPQPNERLGLVVEINLLRRHPTYMISDGAAGVSHEPTQIAIGDGQDRIAATVPAASAVEIEEGSVDAQGGPLLSHSQSHPGSPCRARTQGSMKKSTINQKSTKRRRAVPRLGDLGVDLS